MSMSPTLSAGLFTSGESRGLAVYAGLVAADADKPTVAGLDVFKSIHSDYEAVPHAIVGPLVLVLALVGAQAAVQIFLTSDSLVICNHVCGPHPVPYDGAHDVQRFGMSHEVYKEDLSGEKRNLGKFRPDRHH